jgi:hypothetical protein
VLDTTHEVLSFAAGRWVGFTLVEGFDDGGVRRWFQWGTTRMSEPVYTPTWFDAKHPDWLSPLCDGLLSLKRHEEAADAVRTALYWYVRSNTRGAGIDGSLILTRTLSKPDETARFPACGKRALGRHPIIAVNTTR